MAVSYFFTCFRVQYHDSYKFNAKSYHSMEYHFKSIDTWLMGICQSHCTEHSWKRSKYQPEKKSIFAENQPNGMQDQDAEQEDEEISSQVKDDEKKLKSDWTVDSSMGKNDPCDVAQQSAASNTSRYVFQELSSVNNTAATDGQFTTATTSQYVPRNFRGLDECVNWLLSTISMDLESEFHDVSCSLSELELGSSQWIEAASANYQDKGFVHEIVENPSSNQRTVIVESFGSSGLERSCYCPQCCHIEINCIHQDSSYASAEDNDEETFGGIEDCKEFSSSLECFDFVHCGMNSDDVPIIQCPNNSNSSGRSNSRSVSPSKAAKNGKGGFPTSHLHNFVWILSHWKNNNANDNWWPSIKFS